MLISPPFLLPRNANETDADYVARCMPDTSVNVAGTATPEGSFPVSFKLGWHGGLHLHAPAGANSNVVSVRAIADGEIVFVRRPSARNDRASPGEPRNYNPYGDSPSWTDDGCVIIRHTTEIGANAQNQATEVTFLSIYMHLSELRGAAHRVAADPTNRRVNRKDEIGVAGRIYGVDHQLHFEIVCDDTNLRLLSGGRITGDLNTGGDGRVDAVFGQMYFRLPPGTAFYAQRPGHNVTAPAGAAAHTLQGDSLYVGLRYGGGDGAVADRGDAYLTTYQADGTALGTAPNIAITENEAEYDLYETATAISNAYPAAGRPAPSAVYELLRFGRVIGPDALNPATVPHWREVRYPGGQGWVNLNAEGVHKFSDADLPQWRGWILIDDDTDADSRSESAMLTRLIEDPANRDGQLRRAELERRLQMPEVREKLKRTICKFPSEWNRDTVTGRWGWLNGDPEFGLQPDDYKELIGHINALTIPWATANTGIEATHWHWQPREFVRHFRKCNWVDEALFRRVYPAATAANVTRYRTELNKCKRKYLVSSPLRHAHFYGQAAVESAQLRFMNELYNGDPYDYFRHYAKARNFAGWLGNIAWNDGGDFRGRGFKQMTGRDNYSNYWLYRGWLRSNTFSPEWWRNPGWWGISGTSVPASQYNTLPIQSQAAIAALTAEMRPPVIDAPDRVSTDLFTCIDTAGWFWGKNRLIETADSNDAAAMTRKIRGDSSAVGVTRPWPAAAHFTDRQSHTNRIAALLGDSP